MERGLLTDAVGTLIGVREAVPEVYARLAARHGVSAEPGEVASRLRGIAIGPPPLEGLAPAEIPEREREGWREVVRAALGDEAAEGTCFDALWEHYAGPGAWKTLAGAEAALRGARSRGFRLGLLSNMDSRLPALLESLGLARLFDAIVLPSTHAVAKPDPATFRAALDALGVRIDRALYVGDRERDCLEAARNAGLTALRYGPGGELPSWDRLAGRLDTL